MTRGAARKKPAGRVAAAAPKGKGPSDAAPAAVPHDPKYGALPPATVRQLYRRISSGEMDALSVFAAAVERAVRERREIAALRSLEEIQTAAFDESRERGEALRSYQERIEWESDPATVVISKGLSAG